MPVIDDVTGVVTAGGAATRLGGLRKGLLQFADGNTILDRTLRIFGNLFPSSLLVANEREPYQRLGVPIVGDSVRDRGAPAGLLAAFIAAPTAWVFLAGCDMPALDPTEIRRLAGMRTRKDACIATLDGRAEPLHSFWPVAAMPVLERLLREGEPSFRDLLEAIPHRLVPLESRTSAANVNEIGDLTEHGLSLPRTFLRR